MTYIYICAGLWALGFVVALAFYLFQGLCSIIFRLIKRASN